MMAKRKNPMRRCVAAYKAEIGEKEGTVFGLARLWGITPEALYAFERQDYLPFERAKAAAERWGLPLRELVKPEIRQAIDIGAASVV